MFRLDAFFIKMLGPEECFRGEGLNRCEGKTFRASSQCLCMFLALIVTVTIMCFKT